jgi:hypothetical protein
MTKIWKNVKMQQVLLISSSTTKNVQNPSKICTLSERKSRKNLYIFPLFEKAISGPGLRTDQKKHIGCKNTILYREDQYPVQLWNPNAGKGFNVVDPDPHGSTLILDGWIRIQVGKNDSQKSKRGRNVLF